MDALRRIKLLRKLGVPLEEIRQMQQGVHTVGDGMRRHLITLERERKNIESSLRLCAGLTDRQEPLEELDAQALLDEMAQLEREGTTFMNKQKQDTKRRRYVAPVLAAILMAVLMAGLIWLFLWAFAVDPAGAPPLPVLALFVVIPAAVVVGVIIAPWSSGSGRSSRGRKTMRNDIEKARERRQAILSAIVCGAILLALAAGLLWLRTIPGVSGWLSGLLLILVIFDLAQLVSLGRALWERLQEIEKGELYDSVDD